MRSGQGVGDTDAKREKESMAALKATLETSPRVDAKLRSVLSTCLALQAGDERILCWKLRPQDTILKNHLGAIQTEIVIGR